MGLWGVYVALDTKRPKSLCSRPLPLYQSRLRHRYRRWRWLAAEALGEPLGEPGPCRWPFRLLTGRVPWKALDLSKSYECDADSAARVRHVRASHTFPGSRDDRDTPPLRPPPARSATLPDQTRPYLGAESAERLSLEALRPEQTSYITVVYRRLPLMPREFLSFLATMHYVPGCMQDGACKLARNSQLGQASISRPSFCERCASSGGESSLAGVHWSNMTVLYKVHV